MPEVIFSNEFKTSGRTNLYSKMGSSNYSRLAVFTAGNGISNLSSIVTMNDANALTTGRLILFTGIDVSRASPTLSELLLTTSGYSTASASGTAAEFIWYGNYNNGGTTKAGAIAGTISGPSGGGDIVIADTSIVSGGQYRLQNVSIRIFDDFSY